MPNTLDARTRVSGAATDHLRALLAGVPVSGQVVHVGRDAVYAEVSGSCVGVLARSAVHVPCGVLTALPALTGTSASGDPRPGDAVDCGDGRLLLGGLEVSVARLVATDGPRLDRPGDAGRVLEATVRAAARFTFDAVRHELPAAALAALGAGDPAAVDQLLGRGSGLTPLGDDVLAGWLVTALRSEHPGVDDVSGAVGRLAQRRTTVLSAALLDCARRGEAVPQLRSLLAGLSTPPVRPDELGDALDALLAVGHTSGAGLLAGARLALTPAEGTSA